MSLAEPHVMFVIPRLVDGGAETVVRAVAVAVEQLDVRAEIVTLVEGPRDDEADPGVPVVALGAPRVRSALPALVRRIRRRRPTAVMTTLKHVSIALGLLWFLLPRRTLHVARIANTYSQELDRLPLRTARLTRVLIRLSHRRIDRFACVSAGVRDDLVDHFGIDPDRCVVIPNPVDFDRLVAEATPDPDTDLPVDRAVRFLSVGRLEPQKDQATLLRAFASVAEKLNAHLDLVGDGSLRTDLERLARELSVSDRVRFVGFRSSPAPWYAAADVVVLSSRFEGSPNVLLEALAFGRRCVATDCPHGPAEILIDPALGALVPVGDHEALAAAMRDAATAPSDASAGPSHVRTRHDLRSAAEAYRDVLVGRTPRVTLVANVGWTGGTSGQIQKARAVRDLLQRSGRSLDVIDVHRGRTAVLRAISSVRQGDTIVVVLNRLGLWVALAVIVAAGTLTRRRGPIVVPVVGGWLPDHLDRSRVLRLLARAVDQFLVETPPLADGLRRHGLPVSELANFRSLPIDDSVVKNGPTSPLRLCAAGRIRRDKGVVLAAKLVGALHDRGVDAELDLWGSVDEADALADALAHDGVTYRGSYQTPEEAYALLLDCDLLVLPSSYVGECMPGSVVEACFAGVPSVVSDWADLPFVVHDDQTGVVVPLRGFVDTAADRIAELVAHPARFAEMSKRALNEARSRFTADVASGQFLELIRRLERR